MRAPHWNAIVDAIAYVGFVALAATGLVLRFQLPPGSGGEHGGRGGAGAGERAVTTLWGLTRHDWGGVHYWIALGLLAVLAVHLALHWKWIVCMLRGKKSEASGRRFAIGAASLLGVLVLALVPFAVTTETTTRAALQQTPPGAAKGSGAPESVDHADAKTTRFAALRGRDTLASAAAEAGVDVEALIAKLNLAPDTDPRARFSSFIHAAGLSMDDVRQMLSELADETEAADAETQ